MEEYRLPLTLMRLDFMICGKVKIILIDIIFYWHNYEKATSFL